MEKCRLCGDEGSYLFFKDKNREFYKCNVCDFIFVPKRYFVSEEKEKKQYDQHQNSFKNHPYIEFLNQLYIPTTKFLNSKSVGLDFGSGPEPVLSQMFERDGYDIDIYDYFYANDPTVFEKKYDFITSTEVFEHLSKPLYEIKRLWKCLKVGGVFAIMTGQTHLIEEFKFWYYIRDLTHISFFSDKSFEYIAQILGAKKVFEKNNVIVFKKIKM